MPMAPIGAQCVIDISIIERYQTLILFDSGFKCAVRLK